MKIFSLACLSTVCLCVTLTACHPDGPHMPLPESPEVNVNDAGTVGYDQVRPIFAKNCAACHPSRSGPDWLDYDQAANYVTNGKLLQRVVTDASMPPPGSPQAASITSQERQMIGAWIKAGGPKKSRATAGDSTSSDGPQGDTGPRASSLSQTCFQCHGPHGPGAEAQPKIPRLGGQNENYLYNQLSNFKWRRRIDPSNTMNEVASSLSEVQIRETAHYFATQPGLAVESTTTKPNSLQFTKGRRLAGQYCVSCHMTGVFPTTSDPSVPLLAGQSEQYILNQLLYFRGRERLNPLMNEYTRALSDEDIAALSLFFSYSR